MCLSGHTSLLVALKMIKISPANEKIYWGHYTNMSIPAETIDKIRLGTDIVELVREYIPALKKSGRNWKANCPFHNEKTPSFMINAEKGIFHCFGCSAGGDAFKFVMMMDNLTWPEAIRKLGDRIGVEIKETKEDTVKKTEKQKSWKVEWKVGKI